MSPRRLIVLTVFAVVAAAAAATGSPTPPAQAAGPEPVQTFGYALGNLHQETVEQRTLYLNAIRELAGPGSIVRTDISWPATRTLPDFAVYDQIATEIAAAGLRWLPVVHMGGGGKYAIPPRDAQGHMTMWRNALEAIAKRYGPGGSFTAPGWLPVTAYELWNEPNYLVGNAGGTLTPQDIDQILLDGSAGLRDAATDGHWQVTVIGPGLARIDIPYIQSMIDADHSVLGSLDTLSVHVYMTRNPDLAAGRQFPNRIRTLSTLRTWLDGLGDTNLHLAVTEGGYSGANGIVPPNVVSEALQKQWGREALRWVHANPWLLVDMYLPYNPVDLHTVTYTGDGTQYDDLFFVENLGATRADGQTLKPWGTAYRDDVAAVGTLPASPKLTPLQLVFRSTRLGATSNAATVLQNPGAGVLMIRSVTFSGADAADYTLVKRTCTRDVWPGDTCRLKIAFTPHDSGPSAATLVIGDNTTLGQELVPLSGTGTP